MVPDAESSVRSVRFIERVRLGLGVAIGIDALDVVVQGGVEAAAHVVRPSLVRDLVCCFTVRTLWRAVGCLKRLEVSLGKT